MVQLANDRQFNDWHGHLQLKHAPASPLCNSLDAKKWRSISETFQSPLQGNFVVVVVVDMHFSMDSTVCYSHLDGCSQELGSVNENRKVAESMDL